MLSLKDKLLKAGLVSEEQAKRAESAPKPAAQSQSHQSRAGHPRGDHRSDGASGRPEPRIPKLPPLPGSRQHQREESKKQLELDRALRALVTANEVAIEPGATTFHFVTRKGKLRRLELSEAQAKRLEQGDLAVVERPDPDQIAHALVPPDTAMQMMPLSNKAVRFLAREGVKVGFVEGESDADTEVKGESDTAPPTADTQEQAAPMIAIKRAPLPEEK